MMKTAMLPLALLAATLMSGTAIAQSTSTSSAQRTAPQQQARPPVKQQRTSASLPQAVIAARPVVLVRNTLIALDQANHANNYAVLREMGTPAFRASSAEQLAATYQSMRQQRIDLSRILIIEPRFAPQTQLDARGTLYLIGFFPPAGNRPRINFDLRYANDNGTWKINSINLVFQAAQARP